MMKFPFKIIRKEKPPSLSRLSEQFSQLQEEMASRVVELDTKLSALNTIALRLEKREYRKVDKGDGGREVTQEEIGPVGINALGPGDTPPPGPY